ncbi:MAG: hypothetical protein BIFFINMI_00385 [Phycisphaerae bacterium]|nr:hypothetical protein [Phycisphaerae bacterium]
MASKASKQARKQQRRREAEARWRQDRNAPGSKVQAGGPVSISPPSNVKPSAVPVQARPVPAAVPQSVQPVAAQADVVLTGLEVAKLLKVSRATFFRLVKAGRVPGRIDLPGLPVRYLRSAVVAWLEGHAKA